MNKFSIMSRIGILSLSIFAFASAAESKITKSREDFLRSVTDDYRSSSKRPKEFRVQADGTVMDTRTKLQWMRCSIGQTSTGNTCKGEVKQLSWDEAVAYKNKFATYDDWRLPNRFEQETLIYCSSGDDKGRIDKNHKLYDVFPRIRDSVKNCKGAYDKPTINNDAFPNTAAKPYWTSTPTNITKGMGKDSSWATYFATGSASFGIPQRIARPIRLVRD